MASRQRVLTVVTTIRQGHLEPLREALGRIDREVRGRRVTAEAGALFPFADVGGIHFARFVILDKPDDPPSAPRRLLFTTNFDGETADHLDTLARVASGALDEIYVHCERYPGPASPAEVAAWLRRSAREADAFYVGAPGRPVDQILLERTLCEAVARFADDGIELARDQRDDPRTVRASIQGWVRRNGLLPRRDFPPPPPRPTLDWRRDARLLPTLLLLAGPAILAAWLVASRLDLPFVIPYLLLQAVALVPWYAVLRFHERRDVPKDPVILERLCRQQAAILREREDEDVQNEMNVLVDVKPGWFRTALLRVVLHVIDTLARLVFYRGTLFGITGIHFAHWLILPEDRRLLFVSNYGGSWESYLDEFMGNAASGLTAIWSNTTDFPRTRRLLLWGARNEYLFKIAVRANQIPSQVWYRAYPGVSVATINRHSELRRGLSGTLAPAAAREWLHRI